MIDEWKEVKAFVVKMLLPALMGLSIKLAILSRKENLTVKKVLISFVCGIGAAYLFYPFIADDVSEHWLPLVIAVITISGEKIGTYAMYRLNVERIFDFLIKNKNNG
jgi:hypothetical protein